MDVLGIDFGTSNTVAVLMSTGRPPRVLAIDGVGWLPSCIYVDDDGSLSVGRDAERKARLAPERFEANPKRRIDDGEILLGVRVVPVVDAIAAVLRRVADEARRQLNGRSPDEVHLTHPAQWGASRQNVLLAGARAAGLGPAVTLIPEPVAAAAHFASLPNKSLPPGSCLAVYDLGGGTFDCAVVGATGQGFTVLAESGLPDVGGVDFDQAIIDHLGRTLSAQDPARWQALSRPRTAADRRAARSLREDVRAAKETLSRYAQTDVPMPDPFEDALLTRKEFDGLVRPVIARTVDVLAGTVGRAGVAPDRLAGIYLVGGSSRIPLVASLIVDRLGVVATTLDQPETSVAMGAALSPGNARPQNRTEFVPPSGVAGVAQAGTLLARGGETPPGSPGMPSGPPPGYQGGPGPAASSRPMSQPAGYGPPLGPPPGMAGVPGQGLQGPYGGSGPAPAAVTRSRRPLILIVVAAVVVVAVAVTLILVLRKSTPGPIANQRTVVSSAPAVSPAVSLPVSSAPASTTPPATTPPSSTPASSTPASSVRSSSAAGCDTAADPGTGLSGCLRLAAGTLSDGTTCTQNPDTLGVSKDDLKNFTAVTTAWSACIDNDNGYVTILLQTIGPDGRDLLWPSVQSQFTISAKGSWKSGAASGEYSVGKTQDGDPVVGWKTNGNLPVLAFVIGKSSMSSSDLLSRWKGALGATVGS